MAIKPVMPVEYSISATVVEAGTNFAAWYVFGPYCAYLRGIEGFLGAV